MSFFNLVISHVLIVFMYPLATCYSMSHSFSFLCSGGNRADEQLVPAEAERASDGCFQGGGAQPTAGVAQKWKNGQLP